MIESFVAPWIALFALGALHGVNPGMGWLFAVALSLQEGSGRAVWRALPPLMLGHALAIAAAVAVAQLLGVFVTPGAVRWLVAAALCGIGAFQLRRHRHPRFGGLRVGARDLAVWSFLMASAHGAGLMALPFVPDAAPAVAEAHAHAAHAHVAAAQPASLWVALTATAVHSVGYLAVTALLAALVYHRLGLRGLQRAWVNVDLVWSAALIATAAFVALG